ncbi:hypothetical protein B566_EDAN013998 [Ephemera danica]|nr:hypothetical protein B566_EDAN013998 [Ephemera danica]
MGVIDRKNIKEQSTEKCVVSQSDDELSIPDELSEAASLPGETGLVGYPLQQRRNRRIIQLCVPTRSRKHCGKRRLRYYKAGAWWEFISLPEIPEEDSNGTNLQQKSMVVCKSSQQTNLPAPPEYKRIEKHLKELLQKKCMDVNLVAEVEHQLVEFFLQTPKDILKLKKLTRYEVLVKTAVCQYHGLESDIEETYKKRKALLVSLLGSDYVQPETALHEYLTQRQFYYALKPGAGKS